MTQPLDFATNTSCNINADDKINNRSIIYGIPKLGELVLEMQSPFKAGAKSGTVSLTRQLCRCKKMPEGAFKVLIGSNLNRWTQGQREVQF